MTVLIFRTYQHPWRGVPKNTSRSPRFFRLTIQRTCCRFIEYSPNAWWVQCQSGGKLMTQADLPQPRDGPAMPACPKQLPAKKEK